MQAKKAGIDDKAQIIGTRKAKTGSVLFCLALFFDCPLEDLDWLVLFMSLDEMLNEE